MQRWANFLRGQIGRIAYVRLHSWTEDYPDPNMRYYGYPEPIKRYVVLCRIEKVSDVRVKKPKVTISVPAFGSGCVFAQDMDWCGEFLVRNVAEEGLKIVSTKQYEEWEVNCRQLMIEDLESELEDCDARCLPEVTNVCAQISSATKGKRKRGWSGGRRRKAARRVPDSGSEDEEDNPVAVEVMDDSDSGDEDNFSGNLVEIDYDPVHGIQLPPSRHRRVYKGLQEHNQKTPGELYEMMMLETWKVYAACTSESSLTPQLTMGECYLYHAIVIIMDVIKLPKISDYWSGGCGLVHFTVDFSQHISYRRFCAINSHIRAYVMEDLLLSRKDKKVYRAWEALKKTFKSVLTSPGQHLSMDEAMGGCAVSRNPVYVTLGKKKPLEGFRFFMLNDWDTKVCVNFNLDNKADTAENCRAKTGGFSGWQAIKLFEDSNLQHRQHTFYTDSYYTSMDMLRYCSEQGMRIVGTCMSKRFPIEASLTANNKLVKRASSKMPRGTLKMVKIDGIFLYCWMDNKAVLFADTAVGPTEPVNIQRCMRHALTVETFQVPQAIVDFNNYMGAVDVFDQISGMMHTDQHFRHRKWTTKFFLCLHKHAMANAYNVYRSIHEENESKMRERTEFQVDVIEYLMRHALTQSFVNTRSGSSQVLKQDNCVHTLARLPIGQNGRRLQGRCALKCGSVIKRRTIWYCIACEVALCVTCDKAYHALPTGSRPKCGSVSSLLSQN